MVENKRTRQALPSAERSKKVFIIFSAAFLSLVLIVGIIFGAVGIVRSSGSVMKYKGTYLKGGAANYLSASFKYEFMRSLTKSGVTCYDSESFWQSEAQSGKTWGEILCENTEKYLKRVMVGSYLFDKNTRLTRDDKSVIEKAVDEVLEFRADGDKDKFNELAKDMGFDFRDFKIAAEMLYKYEMAKTVIFGYDGAALESIGFTAECNEYFNSAYSRVKLLFIRTEGEYATDPETGREVFSEYTEDEKAKIQADIAYIRELIYNAENLTGEERMSEAAFDWYINEHKTNTVNDTEGYYFSNESAYSAQFATDAPEVVRLALSMDKGHYAECEVDIGVCFIYKCELEDGAYSRIALAHFFEDFYKNASDFVYSRALDVYLESVTVKKGYDSYSVITRPYNFELAVKFG